MSTLIKNAELFSFSSDRHALVDVRLDGGKIAQVISQSQSAQQASTTASELAGQPESVIDAEGAAVVMGLHDHHIHLLSLAESLSSVKVGPPEVTSQQQFEAALAEAARTDAGDWIRCIGYHESVAGELTSRAIDAVISNRPVKIQHASGAAWMFNTAAIEQLGLSAATPGAELGADLQLTGRFFRNDELLHGAALGESSAAGNLSEVGRLLASCGVTGATDATPGYGTAQVEFFSEAVRNRQLPQNLQLMTPAGSPQVNSGPHKIIMSDHQLPSFAELAAEIDFAHQCGRPVAVHCVTRVALALLVAVFDEVGALPGDRVEHASVAPPELLGGLLAHNLRIVTQPSFVAERGDRYLREVESEDVPWLYRCAGFQEAGLRVAGSTDAPFGGANPWQAIWAAVDRLTQPGGVVLGESERVAPKQALALFMADLDDPGGRPREVAAGKPADVCLLSGSWDEVVKQRPSNPVAATWIGGRQII